ncbi:MAG: nitroreductase [Spirochaetota bacterium]|nr:nitroreductase [Spirochaetota bacterium]
MDIIEAIKKRKSIRDFKSDPVPKEIIKEILEIASRAPSAMNTQPWQFVVVSGDVLDKIREDNIKNLISKIHTNPEHRIMGWPSDSVYRKRQVELAKELFRLMDIQREDKVKRAQWTQRGFRYFNAPAAIIILTDQMLAESSPLLDLGGVIQTICLTAMNYDLGTCIEDQGVMYPDIVRKHVDIQESMRIIMAIAIGYPNWNFPANKIETSRETLENSTSWFGFD